MRCHSVPVSLPNVAPSIRVVPWTLRACDLAVAARESAVWAAVRGRDVIGAWAVFRELLASQ